ncbi:HNH endonuclease [Gemmatimonas sp.]
MNMSQVSFGILDSLDPLKFLVESDGLPARVGPLLPHGPFGAYHDLLGRIASGRIKPVLHTEAGFVIPMSTEEINSYIEERWPDNENPWEQSETSEPRAFAAALDPKKRWALVGRAVATAPKTTRAFTSEPDAMDVRHRIRTELDRVVTSLSEELGFVPEAIADIAYLHLQKHAKWGRNPTKTQKKAAFDAWGGTCQHCHLPVKRGDEVYHHIRRRISGQHEPANLLLYHTSCHDQHHGVRRSLSAGTNRADT